MERVIAKIKTQDGTVLIEQTDAWIEVESRRWYGGFNSGTPIESDDLCLLETADGRSGQIRVDTIDAGSGQTALEITFEGEGPPPT